jgi:hypothetical protein
MGTFEIIFFLCIAIILFILFDVLKIRLTTGYSPTNSASLIVYGPYTVIRIIIISVIYYLLVMIPEIFNVTLFIGIQEMAPFIAGITVPFLYLGLFSFLGGNILKSSGDIGKKVDRWFKKVETTVANESRDNVIWQIIHKITNNPPNWSLDDTRDFFCAQVQMLKKPTDSTDCRADLDNIRTQIVGQAGPVTKPMVVYSIICAWVAWVDVQYPKSTVISGPPSANILRKLANLSLPGPT